MVNFMTIKAITGLICALATVSTVSSQCCDSFQTSCTWASVTWLLAPSQIPDTTSYPNFLITAPSLEYLWVQDKSGSVDINTNFNVADPSTVFSFDYFFDAVDQISGQYMNVYLIKPPISKTLVASVITSGTTWQHMAVPCDRNHNYCCGSMADLPCQVTVEVVVSMDAANYNGLFAIDNIGIC